MTDKQLSKRLQTLADFVDQGERVADIGTDHAFLPIALVQTGVIDFAVASDIGAGPTKIAQENVASAGLDEQISVRQADGLAGLLPEDGISTIVIAGMGGQLITEILSRGTDLMDGTETLILSPNRDEPEVRTWLRDHDYGIVDEAIVSDEGHVYEMMVAGKTRPDVPYTQADLEFGPILRQRREPLFLQKLRRSGEKTAAILEGLTAANLVPLDKIRQEEQLLAMIEEELDDDRQ